MFDLNRSPLKGQMNGSGLQFPTIKMGKSNGRIAENRELQKVFYMVTLVVIILTNMIHHDFELWAIC